MTSKGKCKSCGAPILWAITVSGKNIPLDPEPVDNGNILLHHDGVAEYVKKGMVLPTDDTYVSHFVTCPFASKHRRK